MLVLDNFSALKKVAIPQVHLLCGSIYVTSIKGQNYRNGVGINEPKS